MRHPKVRALCWLVVLVLALPFGARPSAAANSSSFPPPAAPQPVSPGRADPGPAALPPPFAVAPGQLARTLAFGQVVTDTRGLTLTNSTTRPLTVTISELSGGSQPLPLRVTGAPPPRVLVVNQQAAQASAAAVSILTGLGYAPEAVDNVDFESRSVSNLQTYAAVVYLGRTGTTDTNPSNAKLTAYLDAGGRLLIMDNDLGFYTGTSTFYRTYLDATFGADEPDPDGGSVDMTGFDILAGLSVPSADGFPDTFATGASSTPILRYVFDNSVGGSRIARNSYKAVYVASDLHLLGTVTPAEPIERDIVERSLGWLLGNPAADNLPWLAEAPAVVSVPPSGSVNVAISWDATKVPQPGVYTGTLRLSASEAPADPVNVPVRLTVNSNASQGRISGTVTGRGLCDSAPAPLAGATVSFSASGGINGSVTTDANGRYTFFGPAASYTISVARAGHVPGTGSAALAAGDSLTRDFALRLEEPCVGVAPASLSASLLIGQQVTRTLTISNTGAAPLQFGLSELPGAQAGGPDAGGYGWSLIGASWIEAADGTAFNPDDDESFDLTLPFAFPFYDLVSNQLRIGNNGAILVGAAAGDIDGDNLAIASAPQYLVAPFWDDLSADRGQIFVKTIGSSPNRQTVVQWNDRPHYGSAGGIGGASFQAVFFESGSLLFQYKDVDFGNAGFNGGASATVGLRGPAGGIQYSFNAASLQANQALCLPRPGAAACADVPWLRESPTSGTVPAAAGGPGQPASTRQVSVIFDARTLSQPGTYAAKLVVGHDGLQPAVVIPVALEVGAPTSAGLVSGSVEGLRGCDLPGAGL
ncbi:MAG TPA: carboxypeptidase regulatory-like domain-containing protein, partial [Herpetosiphonaceae bacterium]